VTGQHFWPFGQSVSRSQAVIIGIRLGLGHVAVFVLKGSEHRMVVPMLLRQQSWLPGHWESVVQSIMPSFTRSAGQTPFLGTLKQSGFTPVVLLGS